MTGWQWHQRDNMQIICTSVQTDNHASTAPHHSKYDWEIDKYSILLLVHSQTDKPVYTPHVASVVCSSLTGALPSTLRWKWPHLLSVPQTTASTRTLRLRTQWAP